MKCPYCGLENPPTALRCDCGYNFITGDKEKSDIAQKGPEVLQIASAGNRIANFLIDSIFIIIVNIILEDCDLQYEDESIQYLILFLSYVLYYFIFEAIFQRTLGKFITKTKVVMNDGTKPSAGSIIVRTLIRFVPFPIFSQNKEGTRQHDRWTNTRVIKIIE